MNESLVSRLRLSGAGCWEWVGRLDPDGYGRFSGKSAHRVVYAALVGVPPKGLEFDHLCRNRRCCNPDHLELVTRQVNVLRSANPAAMNARKTHCVRGHPLSGPNLYTDPVGKRVCRTCNRANVAAYYRRTRAKGASR